MLMHKTHLQYCTLMLKGCCHYYKSSCNENESLGYYGELKAYYFIKAYNDVRSKEEGAIA